MRLRVDLSCEPEASALLPLRRIHVWCDLTLVGRSRDRQQNLTRSIRLSQSGCSHCSHYSHGNTGRIARSLWRWRERAWLLPNAAVRVFGSGERFGWQRRRYQGELRTAWLYRPLLPPLELRCLVCRVSLVWAPVDLSPRQHCCVRFVLVGQRNWLGDPCLCRWRQLTPGWLQYLVHTEPSSS